MSNIKTVDEYINQFDEEQQILLQDIRSTIKSAAPEAIEKISYGMPAFYLGKNLVYFALTKKHLGFYPTASVIIAFKDKLKDFKTSKGAIQIPFDQELPYTLIKEIVMFRVNEVKTK